MNGSVSLMYMADADLAYANPRLTKLGICNPFLQLNNHQRHIRE